MFLKKLLQITIIFLLFLLFGSVFYKVYAVESNVWHELVNALNKELEVYKSYNDFTNQVSKMDTDTLNSEYRSKSTDWRMIIEESITTYKKYLNNSDEHVNQVSTKALSASQKAISALDQYDAVFNKTINNKEDINTALNTGDDLIKEASAERDEAVSLYNEYSGFNSQRNNIYYLYLSSFIAALFSFILWIKSRGSAKYQSEIIKKQIFRNLFGDSLWLTIGLLITTGTYHYASANSGSSYYIMYGPIGIGSLKMLSGLWEYFTKSKKVLDDLKQQDRNQILKDSIT